MARITTKTGFKSYILSVLGSPVISVEVADSQLDRVIDDVIQVYQKYHTGEGNYRDFLGLNLEVGTSAYSTEGMNIASVVDLNLTFSKNGINELFSATHELLWEDWVIHGNYPGGPSSTQNSGMVLAGYEVATQYLEDIKDTFGIIYKAQYSDARQEILVYPTPQVSGTALMEVFRKETAENLYNDDLVKQLAVAEAKIQWGTNTDKYQMNLPSGGTINSNRILEEGRQDKKDVMEMIIGESEPPFFIID